MKTFNDLEFKPLSIMEGLQARMDFENGYGVSVIRFKSPLGGFGSYTNSDQEWELAVMYNGELTYNTPITDDVIGYLKNDDVSDIMKRVQELKT